jgi:hypothetical protein
MTSPQPVASNSRATKATSSLVIAHSPFPDRRHPADHRAGFLDAWGEVTGPV